VLRNVKGRVAMALTRADWVAGLPKSSLVDPGGLADEQATIVLTDDPAVELRRHPAELPGRHDHAGIGQDPGPAAARVLVPEPSEGAERGA
jgi:hypothetical protein